MKYSKARKTEYRGEVFRSKSEAIFARMLEARGFEMFDYEPEWTQLPCGYIADFSAYLLADSPAGPIEIEYIIEYKPAQVTDTYKEELLERFNELRDLKEFAQVGTLYSLWIGSAFDSEPCKIYTMTDCGTKFYPAAKILERNFKNDLILAKNHRFDLAET